MKLFAFIACLLSLSVLAPADAVDDLVKAEMAKAKIPGVAVLLVRDGKVIKAKGYGDANVEHHVGVRPGTIFQSGSMGKQFTATLVMMLIDQGKLSLDDRIVQFFPEGKGKWEDVTVRHLLSHTSGIGDMPYGSMDMRKDYTEDELVKLMAEQKAPEKPGEKWRYNNGGYVLLGVLIHRVTGTFYGDLLQQKIFTPLGMKTARIITEHDIVSNRAAGYQLESGRLKNQDWVAPKLNTTADGSLYLSLLDMIKWDEALYTTKLLKKGSLARMWTAAKLANGQPALMNPGEQPAYFYGFGWIISKLGGHQYLLHSGAWQGFTSFIGRIPDLKLTVVVFTNLSAGNAGKIGQGALVAIEPALAKG